MRRVMACGCGILLLGGAAAVMAAGSGPAPGPSAEGVRQTAESAVAVRRETQQLRDQWAAEAAVLQAEADALEKQLAHLQWQRGKTAEYMADLTGKISALETAETEAMAVGDAMAPFLDAAADRLKTFVAGDLPLFPEARGARIQRLLQTLGDADADLAAKAGVFFTALAAEIAYGHETLSDEAELDIDGRIVRVHRLSVGRLGLFAVGSGSDVWRWHPENGRWEAVGTWASQIQEALQMADRARLASLVRLPIGRPESVLEEEAK